MPTSAEELLLKISGDATGGEKAVKDITDKVAGLGSGAQGASTKFAPLSKVIEDLTPKTNSASDAFHSMKSILNETFEHPTSAAKSLGNALAGDLLSSLGSVGVAAGLAAGALAVVGVAAFELAEHAAAAGGHLNDMGEKTGQSVPYLSRLSLAAKVAGTDLDQLTSATFMFEKGLGEGSQNTVDGLKRIGLTVNEMKAAGPDQWLGLIATRLKDIEDPTVRAATVMDLFGKQGREIIPTLLKLDDALAATADIQPWTDEQARQAEAFEMQMASLKIHVAALAESLGRDLIPAVAWLVEHGAGAAKWGAGMAADLMGLSQIVHVAGVEWDYLRAALEAFGIEATKIPKVTGDAKTGLEAWNKSVSDMQIAVPSLSDALLTNTTATREMKEAHTALEAAQKKAAEAAKKWSELLADINSVGATTQDTINGMSGAVAAGAQFYLAHGVAIEKIATLYGVTTEQINAVKKAMTDEIETQKVWGTIHEETFKLAQDHEKQWREEALKVAADRNKTLIENLTDEKRFRQEHADAVLKLSATTFDAQRVQTINWMLDEKRQLEARGGDWSKAWEELQLVAQDKMQAIGMAERTLLDEMHGRESTWANGLQQLLGGFPDLMIKGLTGGGGMSGIGSALTSGLGAIGGEQLITKPLTSLFNSAAPALMNTFGSTVTTAIGGAIPVIGPAIGALAPILLGSLKKLFGGPSQAELDGRKVEASFESSFGSFQKMMDAVGAAYAATGRGAQQAQADVKALMDAEKQGGDAVKAMVDKINGAFNEQKQDAADLQTAIHKYGFSIEQLGPTMQKQRLDDQAKTLINDWRLLVGSGMDVVTVDQKMASSTWDYLQMAKKTGQEVPAAMQPVIQSLLDQGVFTDEAGDKITDMSKLGITFSKTMTEGFQSVVDKLNVLIDRIGKVPDALGNIKPVAAPWANWPPPPAMPDYGGGDAPIPMAAGGSFRVTRPTLFLAGEGGDEDVAFSGGGKSFRGMSGGGGVNVTVHVAGNVSTELDLVDAIKGHLQDDLRMVKQFNLRGQ